MQILQIFQRTRIPIHKFVNFERGIAFYIGRIVADS